MAATANHPDGSFKSAAEPDEDIAAIAKQISDHAEVIYQTWKARGLAPNEILTCHNNLKAVDKFGSVLTSKFGSTSSSSSPPIYSSGSKSTSPQSGSPMTTNLICNNRPASDNLEQIVNKFVVEDRARLANRQKSGTDTPVAAAKNYPSSIQFALHKFENRSPETASMSPLKFSPAIANQARFSVSKTDQQPSGGQISASGSTTWPQKPRSDDENRLHLANAELQSGRCDDEYRTKSATLPSKFEKSNGDELREIYMDEVAKEEKKLINALKTGMVINNSCKDSKFTPGLHNQSFNPRLQLRTDSEGEDETDFVRKPAAIKNKPNIISETIQNLCKMSDLANGSSELGGINPSDVVKRRKRIITLPADPVNGDCNKAINLKNTSNGNANNPVRPFLTRGSVAERVMMFEKCPTEIIEKRTKASNSNNNNASWKNLASDVHSKIQNYSKDANQKKNAHPPHTTLQRHTKANKNIFIPRFHYPNGKPVSQQQQNLVFKNIEETFQSLPNFQATKEQFGSVTKACGCPLYWKAPLFIASGGEKVGSVDMSTFLEYWRELSAVCHDDASRFMRIMTKSAKRSYIIPEDLIPLVQDVVNTHPGLTFLKQAPEFHSRYVHTVICRVYYCVNQSWNGQITLAELRKSDFLRAIQLLEVEEDINQVTAYFSYEHFYVIYCKFWELDRDHDLFISKEDLARHSDHALSSRIIDRIFTRTRSRSRNSLLQEGKMSYTDFVIFLLAEEDKRHPRAIEYWFRCMDIDGDGFLSMYELEHFYDEQLQRMEAMGIECLPFEDCLCQMLDMIQPKEPGKISLGDLKRCKMTPIFFDTFFNLEKYLDHEQRDPFASQRDHDSDMSDWDRFAAEEYELLVAEESGHDQCEDVGQYRLADEEEDDDDIFSANSDEILSGLREFVNKKVYRKHNNNYIVEEMPNPNILTTDFGDISHNRVGDDSSDDYAGDSDDCSL